jgi:hypothetical protein
LGVVYAVEFSPAAMAFVAAWFKGQGVFSLNLFDSQWAENFAFITAAGFFTRTDGRYQMTIPKGLNMNSVGRALLQLAATGDRDFPSYPERLLTTMTKEEAHHCVRNLRRLTWNGRIAHRNALLAESGRSPVTADGCSSRLDR